MHSILQLDTKLIYPLLLGCLEINIFQICNIIISYYLVNKNALAIAVLCSSYRLSHPINSIGSTLRSWWEGQYPGLLTHSTIGGLAFTNYILILVRGFSMPNISLPDGSHTASLTTTSRPLYRTLSIPFRKKTNSFH